MTRREDRPSVEQIEERVPQGVNICSAVDPSTDFVLRVCSGAM